MADDDLYAILGVKRDATEEDIRRAYRKLARKHHPDVNPGDASAEERFKKITAAFEVLSKPEKRALYDELGADAAKIGYDPERAEEYRRWKRQSEAAAGFGGGFGAHEGFVDIEDLFGDIFGRARPRRGADVEAVLSVGFLEAARGGPASVEVPRFRPDGSVETARLSITIPAGVETGQRLRLAGQGRPGPAGNGDLYVRIEVADHPLWRRDGNDLELRVPITVPEALLGASVEVPTLEGTVKVKVPARSQSGQRLRLRGKGISGEGDLYVRLDVIVPTGGDDASRERLARELEALYEADVRADLGGRAS